MAVNRIWFPNAPANGISAADRAQIGIGYSGITISAPSVPSLQFEEKLYTQILSSTLVTSYTTKVFPLAAPPETTPPYIIYTRSGGEYINTLSGYDQMENPDVDITICSTGYAQAKTLSNNVHTIIGASTTFKSILIDDDHDFDLDTQLYVFNLNFKCLNKEPA